MSENTEGREQPIEISLSGVLNDLENGITRKEGDKGYDSSRGSIQTKYGLTKSEVDELFRHPALKGKKVKIPKKVSFIIKDDREVTYGTPSAAGEKRIAARTSETPEAEIEIEGVNSNENVESNNESIEATPQQEEVSTVDPQF